MYFHLYRENDENVAQNLAGPPLWADVYDTANHDERRAILQQFIKEIRVRKDYEISITLNASFDQVEQLKAVSTYDGAEIFEEISEKGA